MKRFAFQLESALAYRLRRMEIEQARMEELQAAREALVISAEELQNEWQQAQDLVLHATALETTDLVALESFHGATERRKARIAIEIRQLDERIILQRAQQVEATRQCRLLEKLRLRQHQAWTAEVNKEIENEAADFYLAKWVRQPGGNKPTS